MSEILVPPNIAEACRTLFDLRMQMASDVDVRNSRRRIQDLSHLLQDAENELKRRELPYQRKIDEVEAYIKTNALEVEASFESGGIKVKYVSGYETVSLPKKEIDLIESDLPDLYASLEPFLKTSTRSPRVSIE
jgi:hypothetical protein